MATYSMANKYVHMRKRTGFIRSLFSASTLYLVQLASSPAEPKPAPLLRLCRLFLGRLLLLLASSLLHGRGSLLALVGVLDVVPGDVEEQWLDGEGLEARGVGDDVFEVDAAGGVVGELGGERL